MTELDSRDITRKVEARFDDMVPIYNSGVLLHPIILVVLEVLKEEGFIELEHRTGIEVAAKASIPVDAPSAAVVPSEGKCEKCGDTGWYSMTAAEFESRHGVTTDLEPDQLMSFPCDHEGLQELKGALEVKIGEEGWVDAVRIIYAFAERAVNPLVEVHVHKWVDATNEVITSGEVCFGCMGIRSDNEDQVTAAYLKAFVRDGRAT